MFLTAHALTAAFIVDRLDVQSSVLTFLLGFGSHFVLDAIPHGDEGLDGGGKGKSFLRVVFPWAVGDLVLLSGVTLAMYSRNSDLFSLPVLAAMFGSMVPDGLQVVHHAVLPIPRYMELHNGTHGYFGKRIGIARGLAVQTITVVLILALLLR